MRLRWWLRRKPGSGGSIPGPLDEWLYDTDIVARRIARMTEQRFVADAILGPGWPRRQHRLTWRYKLRRAYRNLRERVARSGEVE